MLTVVHAQTSSTSRALRSSWTVVSRGDCMFPFGFNNWAPRQKQEQGLRITDRIRVARGYFEQETRALRRRSSVSITNSCGIRPALSVGKLVVSGSEPSQPLAT